MTGNPEGLVLSAAQFKRTRQRHQRIGIPAGLTGRIRRTHDADVANLINPGRDLTRFAVSMPPWAHAHRDEPAISFRTEDDLNRFIFPTRGGNPDWFK